MSNSPVLIGITPLWYPEKQYTAMLPSYISALETAGAVPVIIPMTENSTTLDYYVGMCDGILLSGGQDIQPQLYGEEPQSYCGETFPCRDKLDSYVFERSLEQDKPVLGICRGCQAMNVFAGGSLYQDLATDFGTDIKHRMDEPFNREAHLVIPQSGTPLADITGERLIAVNSVHHQAIKRLADDFDIMAVSEDGVIEAIYMPKRRFVWGIQWHPEWFYAENADSAAVISTFVNAARSNKK